MPVLAIDEGNEYSGYCVVLDDFSPAEFGKVTNDELLKHLGDIFEKYKGISLAIEKFESYGMPVGRSVFDSCVWAGRFIQACQEQGIEYEWVSRKEEKLIICGSLKANDTTIRRALINMFCDHDYRTGKGTKKNPDYFYGFKADVWSAFAIGYVYLKRKSKEYML